ncbi:MAG: hypothetical protein ACFB0C_04940 [Leptolyngbyaceae cyanobacterium]
MAPIIASNPSAPILLGPIPDEGGATQPQQTQTSADLLVEPDQQAVGQPMDR